MMMEKKEIIDYPNYEIYKDGRIWSKNKKDFMKPYLKINKKTGRKDYVIGLYNNSKPKSFLLARLLGIHFIPNPSNLPQIDHFDRNTLNNDLSNLRWVTPGQNMLNRGMHKNNKLKLRYIYKKREDTYIVEIHILNYERTFKSEESAILARNAFLEYNGHAFENIDE